MTIQLISSELKKLQNLKKFSSKSRLQNLSELRQRVHFFGIFKIYDEITLIKDQNMSLKK